MLNNVYEEKMDKTISVFEENLSEVRAGRANPAILNKITVSYYGVPTPINQVAGISVPEARMILIQPWDTSLLKEIEKEKPTRHKYGEYQNVLLTDEDLEKLKKEFLDWSDRIERLSAYMASTGKSYKNHLATIRNWARRDSKTPTADVKPTRQASYDLTEFERAAAQKPIVYKRKNND